ncbi:MAG: tRNA pseudouridine(55) synthase TruB [Rhodothermia bacterium]
MSEGFGEIRVLGRDDGFEQVQEGVAVLVDKPREWSSFKVIKLLRAKLGIKKIGHAGTLDPMATGLLICCIGRSATRRIEDFVELDKEYTGIMRLGETTESYDAESKIVERVPADHVTDHDIAGSFNHFCGEVDQIPPMYSAIRVGGRRLYEMARKGETVDRPVRQIRIDAFDIVERRKSDVSFRVVCSKGTYIRSLAHDVGRQLGVGAHLIALRRTRIGQFSVDDALTTDAIAAT